MKDHKMKAVDLAGLLNLSEGLVSDMLNYKKGFSKETIRILLAHFKTSQEAFNRTYPLKNAAKTEIQRGNKISRTRKQLWLNE